MVLIYFFTKIEYLYMKKNPNLHLLWLIFFCGGLIDFLAVSQLSINPYLKPPLILIPLQIVALGYGLFLIYHKKVSD
jgi:hypothetical protein